MSDEVEVSVEQAIENVKDFLRANGSFTWKEWCGMDVADRAAVIEAAEQLDVERVSLLAIALGQEGGLERVASKIDGGDSLVRNGLLRHVANALVRKRT